MIINDNECNVSKCLMLAINFVDIKPMSAVELEPGTSLTIVKRQTLGQGGTKLRASY